MNISWLCRILVSLGRNFYWWSPRQHHTSQSHQEPRYLSQQHSDLPCFCQLQMGREQSLLTISYSVGTETFETREPMTVETLLVFTELWGPGLVSQCFSWTYENEVMKYAFFQSGERSRGEIRWNQVLGPQVKATNHLLHKVPTEAALFCHLKISTAFCFFNDLLATLFACISSSQCGKEWRLLCARDGPETKGHCHSFQLEYKVFKTYVFIPLSISFLFW